MTERVVRAMCRRDLRRDHRAMHRHRLEVLESYELIGSPVVTSTRLAYVPWVQQAVQPYGATRLPNGPAQGLWKALQRAQLAAALQPVGGVEAA
jgi:hypothetical protein